MKTRLFFDATSDAFIIELGENQSGYHDYSGFGGLSNNAGSGKDRGCRIYNCGSYFWRLAYTVTLQMRKNYD